jgi:hypothetical protein
MKAFPRADMKFNSLIPDELGMDLRDYFAGKAMQALLTRETRISEDAMLYAGAAYDVADAMMKAREA